MKKLLLLALLAGISFKPFAQKLFFIYIQTETSQPFFVKMDEKISSSSAEGYLIMPRLHDSTYNFTIGFPMNKWPEQKFSVEMKQKDHGFLLKNFGEKGWGLFDLQTLAVQMSITGHAKLENNPGTEDKDASAFTRILAKASDDPSLLEKPEQVKVVENPALHKDSVASAIVIEPSPKLDISPVVNTELPVKNEEAAAKEEAMARKEALAREETLKKEKAASDAMRLAEQQKLTMAQPDKTEATPPVRVDSLNRTNPLAEKAGDTKQESRLVPKEELVSRPVVTEEKPVEKKTGDAVEIKESVPQTQSDSIVKAEEVYMKSQVKKKSESSTTEGFGLVFTDEYPGGITDTITLVIPNPRPVAKLAEEQPAEQKKFLDFNAAKTDSVATINNIDKPAQTAASNKNCAETATDADFLKLRKRMVAVENNDDMISEARKYFKTKCFTTLQVKNLGVLFLDEDGKYRFFDAVYPYVSDTVNFVTLQSELKEDYYVNRFRAMLRN